MNKIKITQEFETSTQVAEKDKGFMWMQINMGTVKEPDGEYEVQFGPHISVKSPDMKVIVSIPIADLIEQLIKIVRETERNE